MHVYAEARTTSGNIKVTIKLVRTKEGFSIKEAFRYVPGGHIRTKSIELWETKERRLNNEAEAMRRFRLEARYMGALVFTNVKTRVAA